MSSHVELNPDDDMLGLCLGLKAMRLASTQKTHKTGTIRIPTSTGKDFIAGKGAEDGANWIDDEGNQTPLVDTASIDAAVDEIRRPTLPPPVRIRRMRKRRGPASWR